LEGANCCEFALPKACNNVYAAFLKAMVFGNTIRVDILLIFEFFEQCPD
jgi:hypothetical protein